MQNYCQVEKQPEKNCSVPALEGAEYLCWRLWEWQMASPSQGAGLVISYVSDRYFLFEQNN